MKLLAIVISFRAAREFARKVVEGLRSTADVILAFFILSRISI